MSQEVLRFDGGTFVQAHDGKRLSRQLDRVAAIMSDGVWRTPRGIAAQAGGSEASVSARLRDLRKARFGGHVVERRRRGEPSSGVWEYRLLPVVRQ